MKKLFLISICFLLTSSLAWAQSNSLAPQGSQKTSGPVAKWDREAYDFGEIPQGVPVSTTFKITNTGSAPLIISQVKPSCGCTTPSYTKEPIMPGKSGTVKAQYNAANAGAFNKSITVTTNSAEKPTILLYIKGTVKSSDQ